MVPYRNKKTMAEKTKKATRHTNQNEGLIFEKSSPGKRGYRLPPLDVPAVSAAKALGPAARTDLGNMPEVSEIEIAQMAATNPARLLRIDHDCGSIAEGKRADLVALDQHGNVRLTIIGGRVAFQM